MARQDLPAEPGTMTDAVCHAEEVLRAAGVGTFAMSAIPPLVRKLRTMSPDEVRTVACVLYDIAPTRAEVLAQDLVDLVHRASEGHGARRG